MDELAGSVRATLYPNPNNGRFVLELNSARASTVDIQVVNALNSLVYEDQGIEVKGKLLKNINLNLQSGVYFLIINTGEEKAMQKLIITK